MGGGNGRQASSVGATAADDPWNAAPATDDAPPF